MAGVIDPSMITEEWLRAHLASKPRHAMELGSLRKSAVLAPFVFTGGEWSLLLTRRTDDVEHHKGQISFPGGAMEEGEDAIEAALRESEEEIGLDRALVDTFAIIDDLWTPTGYRITPVLGFVRSIDNLVPNPAEVSRILTVPLAFFADSGNVVVRTVNANGFKRDVYFYDYDGETIWGATAFIIRDILRRLSYVA